MSDWPTQPPPRDPTPNRPPSRAGGVVAVAAGALVLLVATVVLASVLMDGDEEPTADAVPTPASVTASSELPSVGRPSTSVSAVTPSTDPLPPEGPLQPVSASATSTLSSQRNACTGEVSTYLVENAIDDDPQSAWASAEDDGAGQRIEVDFDRRVELTSVGLVPGYAKSSGATWNGCRPVERFDLNRWVVRVRYSFDDGSSVEQTFDPEPTLQALPVSASTQRVVVEILETRLPTGAHVDDDSLISELAFRGR